MNNWLSADLVDANGDFVAHSLTISEVAKGTVLELTIPGQDIYASQKDGPYTLTNILLTDKRGATVVSAEAKDVYTTPAYYYQYFHAPAVYLPNVSR